MIAPGAGLKNTLVLFEKARAELNPEGQAEMLKLADAMDADADVALGPRVPDLVAPGFVDPGG